MVMTIPTWPRVCIIIYLNATLLSQYLFLLSSSLASQNLLSHLQNVGNNNLIGLG